MNTCEIADIESSILRELLAYWITKRTGRPLPGRSQFDPLIEAPKLVPHLMLVEHPDARPRFRFRLIGTAAVACMGEDRSSTWVGTDAADKPTVNDRQIIRLLSSAIDARGPTYGHACFQTPRGLWVDSCWLNLPLASDGEVIDMLLAGVVQRPSLRSLSLALPHAEEEIWSIRLPAL